MTIVVIIPDETLQGFTRPAIDLATGQLIELEAEPAPVQLELFTAALDQRDMELFGPLPATF